MPKSKFGQETRVILLLFLRSTLGFLMISESQDQFNICTLVRHTAMCRRHLVYDYLCNMHNHQHKSRNWFFKCDRATIFSLQCAIVLKTMFGATKKMRPRWQNCQNSTECNCTFSLYSPNYCDYKAALQFLTSPLQ